ncbi:hypothetical protein BDB01DRAFT_834656 [Pilobolus umbonatus]|nr:hypothetical protein BDB01DRAFT_834656 [Pilobolus umbonatus]
MTDDSTCSLGWLMDESLWNEPIENIRIDEHRMCWRIGIIVRQFVQISFEKEALDCIAYLKESLVDDSHRSTTTLSATTVLQKEQDGIFLDGCSESVSTLIKDRAATLRQSYHSLDSNGKAIVTFGLNSILDLSFKYPAAQAKLFKRKQRNN